MGFFSFIETFFFISLAITFVLILLLVYHFKDRLTIVEQKNDKMLSIINGLMQEVTILKRSFILSQTHSQPTNMYSLNHQSHLDTLNEEEEEEEEEDDGDEEEDNGDEEEEFRKIEVSDTETELDEDTIKVINVPISYNTCQDESSDEDETGDMNEVTLDELNDDTIDIPLITNEDPILVTKIEETDSLEESEKWDVTLKKNDFKRMDVSVLRTMVISRGLATDTKKMKKNDLVRLLEEDN